MKIQDFLIESLEDDIDVIDSDFENESVENIVMQLRKALDYNGDYPVKFNDGSAAYISEDDINTFLTKLQSFKPNDRLTMQNEATKSLPDFYKMLKSFNGQVMSKSIYEGMSHSRSGGPTQYI